MLKVKKLPDVFEHVFDGYAEIAKGTKLSNENVEIGTVILKCYLMRMQKGAELP